MLNVECWMFEPKKKETSRRGWGGFFFSRCPGKEPGPKGYLFLRPFFGHGPIRDSRSKRSYFFFLAVVFFAGFLADFLAAAFFAMALTSFLRKRIYEIAGVVVNAFF